MISTLAKPPPGSGTGETISSAFSTPSPLKSSRFLSFGVTGSFFFGLGRLPEKIRRSAARVTAT